MRVILDKPLDEVFEECAPYLFALVSAYFWQQEFLASGLPDRFDKLIEASINILSILMGFLGTALAIIFAIENKPVIVFLKRNYKFRQFVRYFFEAAAVSFLSLICSFILNGIRINWDELKYKWAVATWLICVTASLTLSMRVIWLLYRVLNRNSELEEI